MSAPEVREERAAYMPVSMALKLAQLTLKQACEQAYRDTELLIREADQARQAIEDKRSVYRNRNRTYVLLAGFAISLVWPVLAVQMFQSNELANYASALGYTGDIAITLRALHRRY